MSQCESIRGLMRSSLTLRRKVAWFVEEVIEVAIIVPLSAKETEDEKDH
jgi:hypothetical protein